MDRKTFQENLDKEWHKKALQNKAKFEELDIKLRKQGKKATALDRYNMIHS